MNDTGSVAGPPARHSPVTAVVPAAGLGTRLRPLSDAIPKEMLPLGRNLVLEHIVSELAAAGIQHVAFVLSAAKEAVVHSCFGTRRDGVDFSYVLQPEMRGLGDAVLRAEPLVGDSFVVALGDAVFEEPTPGGVTRRLIDAAVTSRADVALAVQRVAGPDISRYGVVRPLLERAGDGVAPVAISDIVEKPAAEEAPSDLAAAARYVVTRPVFDALRATAPDARGELQFTHALQRRLRAGHAGVAVPLRPDETRHDIGAFDSYFRAFVTFALADEQYGPALRRHLAVVIAGSGQEAADTMYKEIVDKGMPRS